MSFEIVIEHYGYAAILIGTFFEGEAVLVIAGFLAHHGYLRLDFVIAAAFAGSLLGDQLYFYLGRWKGPDFVASRPYLSRHRQKVERLLHKNRVWLILGFRFIYGLRTVTPLVLGASQVPAGLFLALNFISAFAWAAAVGFAGYYFGTAIEAVLGQAREYEFIVIGLLACIALVLWTVRLLIWRHRKAYRNGSDREPASADRKSR